MCNPYKPAGGPSATLRPMTRAFEATTTIDRPVGEVWRELTDWERAPRWMPGVSSMSSDAGTAVGATISFASRGKVRSSTIAAVEPERSVTLHSVQGGVTARYAYRLEPDGRRTRAVLTADVETAGFPWVLLGPLIRTAVRRSDAGQLGALRVVVEGMPTG
jgi:carbon monoxide dehydrogenase subunit G